MEKTKLFSLEVANVVATLVTTNAKRAIKYLSPILVVRGVRTTYGGKINKRHNVEVTLTIGKPNYAERQFIRSCKKAKEPFPVKKIQLKFPA